MTGAWHGGKGDKTRPEAAPGSFKVGYEAIDWNARAKHAYELGWRAAAEWAKRDDLLADIGSPAYLKERDAALGIKS